MSVTVVKLEPLAPQPPHAPLSFAPERCSLLSTPPIGRAAMTLRSRNFDHLPCALVGTTPGERHSWLECSLNETLLRLGAAIVGSFRLCKLDAAGVAPSSTRGARGGKGAGQRTRAGNASRFARSDGYRTNHSNGMVFLVQRFARRVRPLLWTSLLSAAELAVLTGCTSGPPAQAKAPDVALDRRIKACSLAARVCAGHARVWNAAGMVDCMAENVLLAIYGSRQRAIDSLGSDISDTTSVVDAQVSSPTQLHTAQGAHVYAIVPQRMVVRRPEGRVALNSYLIAVSLDDGSSWKFVDGTQLTAAIVTKLFPDFPAAIELPAVGSPTLLPNGDAP